MYLRKVRKKNKFRVTESYQGVIKVGGKQVILAHLGTLKTMIKNKLELDFQKKKISLIEYEKKMQILAVQKE